MSQFKVLKNTDKEYPCVSCSGTNVSIIREDPTGSNPRLKCNQCNFMFNASDSLAASEAGVIKASSAEALASASEPELESIPAVVRQLRQQIPAKLEPKVGKWEIPSRPAYVFVAKDKTSFQFCSKREFKSVAITWSSLKHDVYELKAIKLNVKIDVE